MMEQMLSAHYGELMRAARALARDASEADDIMQEALLSALRSEGFEELDEDLQLRWLKRAMKSRLIDIRRRERLSRQREVLEREPTDCDDLTYIEVMQALGVLKDEQRQVLAMSALGGMNSTQIAQTLGIPAPTVRTRLRAAVKTLRAMRNRGDI
ncbi:MAG: RNA polymerase sigma factor [Candidatus Fimadaptatus sp.]|jgi:RNA polymerase sigma-70 factor (ECF subfamily)